MREPETLLCFLAFSGRHIGRHFDPIRKWFSPPDPLLNTLNIVPTRKFSIRNNARARDANVFSRFFGRHIGRHCEPIRKWFSPSDPLLDSLNTVPSWKFSIRNNARARDVNVFSRFFWPPSWPPFLPDSENFCAIGWQIRFLIRVNFFRFLSDCVDRRSLLMVVSTVRDVVRVYVCMCVCVCVCVCVYVCM